MSFSIPNASFNGTASAANASSIGSSSSAASSAQAHSLGSTASTISSMQTQTADVSFSNASTASMLSSMQGEALNSSAASASSQAVNTQPAAPQSNGASTVEVLPEIPSYVLDGLPAGPVHPSFGSAYSYVPLKSSDGTIIYGMRILDSI